MSRDAFLRLGLFATAATIAGGLVAAALWLSPWVALGALLGGALLAGVATFESSPELGPLVASDVRAEGGLTRVDRVDTERRARRAREAASDVDAA